MHFWPYKIVKHDKRKFVQRPEQRPIKVEFIILYYVFHNTISMVEYPQIEEQRVRIQSFYLAGSRIIKTYHMTTRSVMERVFVR